MNDDDRLTFWEHLDVLRGSLIRMLVAAVAAGIVAFVLKDSLFAVVLAPADGGFVTYRLLGAEPFTINLINTGLAEQFMIHMKVALVAGVLIASPYILYVLFRFIRRAESFFNLVDNVHLGFFVQLFGLCPDNDFGAVFAHTLQVKVINIKLAQRIPHFININNLRRFYLHQDTAGEINSEVKPLKNDANNRQ